MSRVHPVREDLDELGLSLARALRYVAAWGGQRVVLKFGGAAMDAGVLGTLIEDVVERAAQGMHHAQPFWYYLKSVPVDLLPWTFLAVPAACFPMPRA